MPEKPPPPTRARLRDRLLGEVRKSLIFSAYFYVCFLILLLYEASLLAESNIYTVHYGTALAKALVLGKFIVLGEAIELGEGTEYANLARRIAGRTIMLLAFLVLLEFLEEFVVGLYHGRALAATLSDLAGRPWIELLAPVLVLLLVLVPLVSTVELGRSLGFVKFERLLFQRRARLPAGD